MRQLAYGVSADALAEFGRLAESTNLLRLKKVAEVIFCRFAAEWLRLPKIDEIAVIERHYRALGYQGCIGCVDCASWSWAMCPIGWQGLFGKDKKPTIRMEVICDDYLILWWMNFGAPGAKNDINIFYQSPFLTRSERAVGHPRCH
jgi:hypothetical protein